MEEKLSVIIPCYNEEKHIEVIVEKVLASDVENIEIIIVDDCSTDATPRLLKEKLVNKVDKILYHESNMGKGAALRTGIKAATGDYVIIQDADLEYDPQDYLKLVEPLVQNKAKIVYGSRFLDQQKNYTGYRQNLYANLFLTWLSNCFTGFRLTDMETCYKVFRREIIQSMTIEENRFGFEPEITSKCAKAGYAIHEVAIAYHPRTNAEGKKIRFKDGLRAIYCIFKYR